MWPTGEIYTYFVNENTTIESLLKTQIWTQKYFEKEADATLYWLFTTEDEDTKFPKPISREKKILKLMYKDEKMQEKAMKQTETVAQKLKEARSLTRRQSILNQQKLRSSVLLDKNLTSQQTKVLTEDIKEFRFFTLQLRRRIYPSLYHLPYSNFKQLSSSSRNFIFNQGRQDYVERDILKRPILSQENATLLAALILKVKYQTKILRSKENTLSGELIKKSLDYSIPRSMLITQKSAAWEDQIIKCFEQQNLKELTIDEAQDQFLVLLSSFEFMFASYYLVSQKPKQSGFRLSIFQNQNLIQRKTTINESIKNPIMKKKSRFQQSDSSEDSENDQSKSKDKTQETISEESDDANSDEELYNKSKDQEEQRRANEVFQEYFQASTQEILTICTNSHILFVENRKRDKILLKVKYEDILYLMGKKDEFKIQMTLKKKMGQNNNETFDCKSEFLIDNGGARSIAEDILTYCQIHLLEQNLNHQDYCDFVKRNLIDGLFETEVEINPFDQITNGQGKGLNLIIDDDILLGNINFAQKKNKKKLESNIMYQENENSQIGSLNLENDDDLEFNLRGGDFNNRIIGPFELHEKKIQKQVGLQIKFKQPNFLIYMKKHPLYNQVGGPDQPSKILNSILKSPKGTQKTRLNVEAKQTQGGKESADKRPQEQHKTVNTRTIEKPKFKPTIIQEDHNEEVSSSSSQTLSQNDQDKKRKLSETKSPSKRGSSQQVETNPNSILKVPQLNKDEQFQSKQVNNKIQSPQKQEQKSQLEQIEVHQVKQVENKQGEKQEIKKENEEIKQVVVEPPVLINSNSFMAQYNQSSQDALQEAKQEKTELIVPKPINIKFEKLKPQDKKKNLGKVMSSFGPPPP